MSASTSENVCRNNGTIVDVVDVIVNDVVTELTFSLLHQRLVE